ncbi:hypothetical protein NMY22_g18692 [Coprinellus aureogranulatus]|nr:hypothetical protein NMY22_g18692 [Coprinellus aureogranulatus]
MNSPAYLAHIQAPPPPPTPRRAQPGHTDLLYELPSVVRSIRDGFQMAFQSAAVVSGLLAAAASQLYGFFKSSSSYSENTSETTRDAIVGLCYVAMFLNIGATLSGFMIIDALGEVQYQAATPPSNTTVDENDVCNEKLSPRKQAIPQLLERYSRGNVNTILIVHWLISFWGGILSLLILIILYVSVEERLALKVVAALLTCYVLLPGFAWLRPVLQGAKASHHASTSQRGEPLGSGIAENGPIDVEAVDAPLLPQHATHAAIRG